MPNHHHLVLGQADGFHRAAELLRAEIEPAFELPADCPTGVGTGLTAISDHLGLLIPPSVVCLAFAIELILKTLLVQEGVFPDPTLPRSPRAARGIHELDKLFDKLPAALQGRIRNAVDDDLDARLAEHAKTFTDWRYVFELGDIHTDDEFLLSIWAAARDCVLP